MAQLTHEYLIEQLKFTGDESISSSNKIRLNFNHPVKNSYGLANATPSSAAMQVSSMAGKVNNLSTTPTGGTAWYSTMATATPSPKAKLSRTPLSLVSSSKPRPFDEREGNYFNLVQPFHVTNVLVVSTLLRHDPEEHQLAPPCDYSVSTTLPPPHCQQQRRQR